MNFLQDAQSQAFAASKKRNEVQAHDVGMVDPFEYMQKQMEEAMDAVDKDKDGQIDDEEWRELMGDYAKTSDEDKEPEDVVRDVCKKMKTQHPAESDELLYLFKWFWKSAELFDRKFNKEIEAVHSDLEMWVEPFKDDQGRVKGEYQALIQTITNLEKRIKDPALAEDPQDFELLLRETLDQMGTTLAKGSMGAWLLLLDQMGSSQERKRKLIFGCHKISAKVAKRLEANTTSDGVELPSEINGLVQQFGPTSILDSNSSPSALGIDIMFDMKAPKILMCLVADIDHREQCFCADGKPCGRSGHENIKIDLGKVHVSSPPDFER